MIGLLLSMGAWAGVSSIAPSNAYEEALTRRVAMVVGIDAYTDPTIEPLRYAAKDARDIAGVLEARGGFEVELVTGSLSREAFLETLAETTAELNQEDTFLLYFAGHGSLTLMGTNTRHYLLPSDAEMARLDSSAIALDELQSRLAGMRMQKRVLIIDACHSISGGRSQVSEQTERQLGALRAEEAPQPIPVELEQAEIRMYAAQKGQPAQEDTNLKNGVYTHFLVKGMRGEADIDQNGRITAQEAHDWAGKQTREHTGQTQWPLWESRRTSPLVLIGTEESAVVVVDRKRSMAPRDPDGEQAADSVHTLRAGVGAAWIADLDGRITTPWTVRQVGWWEVSDGWELGIATSQALGEALAPGMTHIFSAEMRMAKLWGDAWAVGPNIGQRARMRLWEKQTEVGYSLLGGAHARWAGSGWFVGVDVGAEMAFTNNGYRFLPETAISTGFHF